MRGERGFPLLVSRYNSEAQFGRNTMYRVFRSPSYFTIKGFKGFVGAAYEFGFALHPNVVVKFGHAGLPCGFKL